MQLNSEVALGTTLLDKKLLDWPWLVDTDRLDMADPYDCVVGQLYGDFHSEIYKLLGYKEFTDDARMNAISHGFTLDDNFDAPLSNRFKPLTQEWRNLILFRRGELVRQ